MKTCPSDQAQLLDQAGLGVSLNQRFVLCDPHMQRCRL